jgi:hypothetical protein
MKTRKPGACPGEPLIQVREMQSVFHPSAQRTASRRRDAHRQSRLFARWNQSLRRSPTPTGFTQIVTNLDEESNCKLHRRVAICNPFGGVLAQLVERLNGINARLIFSHYLDSLSLVAWSPRSEFRGIARIGLQVIRKVRPYVCGSGGHR